MEFSSADELERLGFHRDLTDTYKQVYGLYTEYEQRARAELTPEQQAGFKSRPATPVLHDAHLPTILAEWIHARDAGQPRPAAETWYGDYALAPVDFVDVPGPDAAAEQQRAWGSRPVLDESPGRDTGTFVVRYHAGSPDRPAQIRHRETLLGTLSQQRVDEVRPASPDQRPRDLAARPAIGTRKPAASRPGIRR